MQLVRTAQPKHKINLLSLSTGAGGPDVGHLVCSINSMQFVRTAQFKHKHLLALYSHSPRRTGGPQAPASGALVNSSFMTGMRAFSAHLLLTSSFLWPSTEDFGSSSTTIAFQVNASVSYLLDYSVEDIYDDDGPLCPCFNP